MNPYMQAAIEEAEKSVDSLDGGPFGAVVVKDGKIISRGHNQVVKSHDPTAHAEMQAIRKAAEFLETFDLSGCVIYTTGEPCPMCYSAIHWARIDKIYYGCTRADAAAIGFDDELIYDVLKGKVKHARLKEEQIERDACLKPFNHWHDNSEKTPY
jgi:guanine deaminase